MSKKVALPQLNMNNPHNMWTDKDQTVIYQTEWFSNKLDVFDRETLELIRQVTVGPGPIARDDAGPTPTSCTSPSTAATR